MPFAQGNYKQIFATLPNTKLGDQIFIIRGGTLYAYKVENVFEVKPTKIEIMKQSTDSILTLSTCVPIGTATRRFIVQAKQISPNPKNNQAFSGTALDLTKRIPAS
ncbi:MAG: sortase family protein [uncultured bacterium]|nr:MAG: sortase family protein [uncultured bacterium]